ncbi:hypothetical protein JZ751_022669 [Albula glossodonta]|uniref:Arf-GAP with Rho-GAP domain, ANK repeat and PH domain-containing protein 1 n=1 Tax=Albula glossodonta TaxID=121402 RepID=A0A8T2PGW7_9TELE|nr:hypothetical protein JZ751_022669 [Albula glossodonta]
MYSDSMSSICGDSSNPDRCSNISRPSISDSISLFSAGSVALQEEDPIPHASTVIKMGWLEKTPPQGSLIFQRRWVRLDTDYLKYFKNDKMIFSKRIIPITTIINVARVGEQRFEVVTPNRILLFRVESKLKRNEWIMALQGTMWDQRQCGDITIHPPSHMQGLLELQGHSKIYTVACIDKVFLYRNAEEFQAGIGITSIEMNMSAVKDTDRRAFELITPYKTFRFIAESGEAKEEWVEAMRSSINESFSSHEVAKKIWSVESNRFCADCGKAQPKWAAINLCVVICEPCAVEHRHLGSNISKVQSLEADKKVWTDEFIQLFLLLGNEQANVFWAANMPPGNALSPSSTSEDRESFISAKYQEGRYRCYHQHFGHQEELNNALCMNLQTNDVLETLCLVFCGADVHCDTGCSAFPTPISLAESYNQALQAEFLRQNQNTYIPSPELRHHVGKAPDIGTASITRRGYLFKTGSMTKPITTRRAKEEFSQRWCTLNYDKFSYYANEKNSSPNGELKMKELACLAVNPPEKHGYAHTFEIYSTSGRLYLFGADDLLSVQEWIKSIAKAFIPLSAGDIVCMDFERIGKLCYRDELNVRDPQVGYFSLAGTMLHGSLEGGERMDIDLRKLNELCNILSQQQLTHLNVPVIVDCCSGYIAKYGLTLEGIYRKSGVNSSITTLLEVFRQDARRVEVSQRAVQYQSLLSSMPPLNKATLQALINHLHCIQHFEDINQMSQYNLAIVFGPTQFQTDGRDSRASQVVEELIGQYVTIFSVNEQELQKQLEEIRLIMKLQGKGVKQIPDNMTAAELVVKILAQCKISLNEQECWSCFEMNEREGTERSLHYQEKVLPIIHSLGTEKILLVKRNFTMKAMLSYLGKETKGWRSGVMKFREERTLLGRGSFHDRFFVLSDSSLRLFKEVQSIRPEREWPVKSLKVYEGIKARLGPPTRWGMTIVSEDDRKQNQRWYMCFETQIDMIEWMATFMSIQHKGNVWPEEYTQVE